MIGQFIIPIITLVVFASCSSFNQPHSFDRSSHPEIFAALDAMPDGYQGDLTSSGEIFHIRSTHVNETKLCRLVVIEGKETFHGESFCKIKGGEWR